MTDRTAPRIVLDTHGNPADQIENQIRGFIATGRLRSEERLPAVRQLAADLGIAPGTVARAYRALEQEGLVTTRRGAGGTRVSQTAADAPGSVVEAARALAIRAGDAGLDAKETARILEAVWPTTE